MGLEFDRAVSGEQRMGIIGRGARIGASSQFTESLLKENWDCG